MNRKSFIVSWPALVGIVVALAVIVFLGSKAYKYKTTTNNDIAAINNDNIEDINIPGWKSYTNSKYNFTIKYPESYTKEEGSTGFYNDMNLYGITIRTPKDYQKGTDFNIGMIELQVGTSTASCYSANGVDNDMTVTKNINGNLFYYSPSQPFDDAAMGGQRGYIYIYSLIKNDLCYRIIESIGYRDLTGFMDNYVKPPHFDEQQVNSDFDSIIATLNIR